MSQQREQPGREALVYHPSTVSWAVAEVVARPPSFLSRLTLYAIVSILAGGVVYSYFAKIAVTVSGRGIIRSSAKVRPVRAQVTGRVESLFVKNGQHVKKGTTLVEMQEELTEDDLARFKGLSSKIDALLAAGSTRAAGDEALALSQVPMNLAGSVLVHERGSLSEALSAYGQAIHYLNDTLPSVTHADSEERSQNMDKLRRLRESNMMSALHGEAETLEKNISHLSSSIHDRESQAREKIASAHSSLEVNRRTFEQALHTHVDSEHVIAPVDGEVSNMSLTGVGELVTAGQNLFQLIPEGGNLIAEIDIANKDIGELHKDMPVRLKFDAFEYQDFGSIEGRIIEVPDDVRTDEAAGSPTGGTTGSTKSYQVLASLNRTEIEGRGARRPIRMGMTMTADIRLRQRTLLQMGIIEVLKLKDIF